MSVFKGTFYSSCLKKNTSINIIFPDLSIDVDPLFDDEPKLLYLLHGLGGNEDEWLRFTKIEYYAKKYNFMIVMPDAQRSFYCNTGYGIRYSDYIAEEVPAFIAKWFKIKTEKENTYIAGESMGGFGALKIGLSYPERYAGIGAMSAVVDLDGFHKLAEEGQFIDMSVKELDVLCEEEGLFQLVTKLKDHKDRPKLIQLCGRQDFLYEDNLKFAKHLAEYNYGHTFTEAQGDHEWPYWDKAIQYVLMFFRDLDPAKTRIY